MIALAAIALVLAPAPVLAPVPAVAPLVAQGPQEGVKPRLNDPSLCPYCKGDPVLMKAAGIVSHGGFPFATRDTADVDRHMATSDIRWIETAHFVIGIGLGTYKIDGEEKKKIEGELARLIPALPDVPERIKTIDPWLRAHIYAMRCEDLWKRMLSILRVEESVFPTGKKPWDMTGKYMGEGPFLGEKSKYEVLIVPSKQHLMEYLSHYFGLTVQLSQRWNVVDRDAISITIRADDGQLRKDMALHGHVAFNLAQNLLDGYKHYSYDTPVWLHEGLAHVLEREIDPDHNSFDSAEGAVAEMTSKSDWNRPVRELIARGTAPRMAELINLRTYAELELPHHFVTWSMVEFLLATKAEGFACLIDALKGRTDAQGYADGSNMKEAHREAFQRCIGMSYTAFDEAWKAWVLGRAVER